MKRHGILVLIVLILILIGGWWVVAHVRSASNTSQSRDTSSTQATPTLSIDAFALPISITHSLSDKTHTYAGVLISTKNECGVRSSGITTEGQNPMHISLMLETSRGACEAVATTSQSMFEVALKGTGSAMPVLDSVTLDGQSVAYTVHDK